MDIFTPLSLIFPFLSIFLFLLHTSIQWRFGPARKPSSSGPYPYPIIGCLLSFYKNRMRLLDWYTDMLSASASQTITISRFGARRTIVTANPHNVRYMLKTNFGNYPKGRAFTEVLGDFLGNGIFNVDGELWYNQRKLVVHQFNAKSLREYVDDVLRNEVEGKLIRVLESAAAEGEGKSVDLQDLLRRMAFDLVCRVSLGYDPCCLEYNSSGNEIVEAFDVASEMCARRGAAPLALIWKVKRLLGIGSEKKLKEAIFTIHLFVNKLIRDRRRILSESKSELESESNLLTKMVVNGENDEVIRDTIISFIMAGRDTTSAAMTWLFYLLSRHPRVENELVREVKSLDDVSKHDSWREHRLLKACICESMRLFPPVAWDSKHAVVDDYLPDGTRVWAGDRVTYFPYGMGRMKGLWGEDRFDFKPERWVSEMEDGRIKSLKNFGPYKFPVFQGGPRDCPGKEMAFAQMKYVVAAVVKRFEFRPVSLDRPVFVPLLTAHMAGGFQVHVSRRQ